MKDAPKFLVLMTAYNALAWIERQVSTILEQVGAEVELYISVDLSSDGTQSWCEQLASRCANVHLLPYGERFGGAGANFFRLIHEVPFDGFDYIAFSDHDDLWVLDKLHHAHQLISTGGFDAVSSDVEAFWEDGRRKIIKKSYPQRRYDHFFEAAGPGCTYVLTQPCASAFKDFLAANSGTCTQVALHDWLIYAFCRERGFSWYIDFKPVVLYRQHGSNQVGSNSGWLAYWKRYQLIKTHWYRRQVLLIASLFDSDVYNLLSKRSFLIRSFLQLRRRRRDQWVILFLVILGLF